MRHDSDTIDSHSETKPVSVVYMIPGWLAVTVLIVYALIRLAGGKGLPAEAEAEYKGWDRERVSDQNRARVLLVHSYHNEDVWAKAVTRGVRMATSRSNVDLQVFYMDTRRHTDESFGREAGLAARKAMNQWMPRVVIAADDNAQEYFAKDHVERDDVQIVFCGVNAEPRLYGYPAANVTGVQERPHLPGSLKLLQRLRPNARRVALLSDHSPVSQWALEWMKGQAGQFDVVICEAAETFGQWQAVVQRAQEKADALVVYRYDTLHHEGNPELIETRTVMAWTTAHSLIPIVGLLDTALDDGAVCGQVQSGVAQGMRAGQMALEILSGKTAEQIPVVSAPPGPSMVNLRAADRLGIRVAPEVAQEFDVVLGD